MRTDRELEKKAYIFNICFFLIFIFNISTVIIKLKNPYFYKNNFFIAIIEA